MSETIDSLRDKVELRDEVITNLLRLSSLVIKALDISEAKVSLLREQILNYLGQRAECDRLERSV